MVIETALVLLISSNCERGFSAVKSIKKDWRATMKTDMLDKLLLITMEGPDLDEYDAALALHKWWTTGVRARRPQFQEHYQESDGQDPLLNFLIAVQNDH